MRVVSLNIWGGHLLGALITFLQDIDADVLCLQEVLDSSVARSTQICGVNGARLNLFEDLSRALPGHHGIFCPSIETVPDDAAFGDTPILSGIATFVRKGIPIIKQCVDFVHKEFEVIPRGEPPLPRIAHAFSVWDARAGKTVGIAHMHGLWTPGEPTSKLDTLERIEQAQRFASLVRFLPPGRRIACGDWNVLPESETFDILEHIGMRDLVRARGVTDTRTSYYKKPVRYADYMCVSREITVTRFDVPAEPEVSDHRPLLLEF